ncbi:uncharacterized protein [Garra rufa]|uniref:uncharacterized protein n=1 Tax=Garra rufa TaxID=137080 RepID=UPI003CCEEA0E
MKQSRGCVRKRSFGRHRSRGYGQNESSSGTVLHCEMFRFFDTSFEASVSNVTSLMTLIFQVISLLAIWTYAHTAVRTVHQGTTVTEPVIKAIALNKDDQLIASRNEKMCAQYFCNNGTCHNSPELVVQFQENSGNLCLIIPNVNINHSGQYKVVLNGYKDVLNFTLQVEEVPQQPVWLIPVIVIAVALLAAAFLIIFVNYKKKGCSNFQRTASLEA